ncbi:alpha/beta hydrolase [Sphingomonas sp. A2-49]|uniref:alpha/beta hydrolase n=1 Tax=Sphingomonas sp. A2-49 TaxID=1391375 RepID=UPI0021D2107B|nr:alpha/beta hydrolase [Sphingomonas sp. A2-49]MCU6455546.1 alpha/beta hydrolase [Sphingomonas sp. A2-49]
MLPILPQPPLAETIAADTHWQLRSLLALWSQPQPDRTIAEQRTMAEAMTRPLADARIARFGVTLADATMHGVPVKTVAPPQGGAHAGSGLLINLHGGGFVVDAGSLAESVPIAALSGVPVVTVQYRLAPEHPFPAPVDDALAVYRAALERYPPGRIAVFGTSAGAILTAQLLARLKHEGLPMPAAAGIFSGTADLARAGDIEGYLPPLPGGRTLADAARAFAPGQDPRDPLFSPLFGDLADFPPMLLMTSTRDQLLSQTVMFHLALRAAGIAADLIVHEAMPHAFWALMDCHESDVALRQQAAFLRRALA